jgi:hypothetical protein
MRKRRWCAFRGRKKSPKRGFPDWCRGEGVPRKSWVRYGIHSERGKDTVARVADMLAGHDLNHLKQIKDRLPKSRA